MKADYRTVVGRSSRRPAQETHNIFAPQTSNRYGEDALNAASMHAEQDQRLTTAVTREQSRLRNFIRKRVGEEADVEDILQDVFFELLEAYRLLKPVEEVTAWLYRVARNRMIDRFRKHGPVTNRSESASLENGEAGTRWEELLPSPDAGPEARYTRGILLEELEAALAELPAEQRHVFLSHEFEGRSFKEMAEATGVKVNTLLARKRYAVMHLRERLKDFYNEFLNK
jgi:RNA polymerase sigma factor (sigma-70 family)